MSYIEQLGKNAQKASKTLISLGSLEKNNLLRQVATALVEQAEMILAENARVWPLQKKTAFRTLCSTGCV